MKVERKFSPERLYRIRRLRKARRYFKQSPLFAYERMMQEYSSYSYAEFLNDLRRRTKPMKRRKKRKMTRYGRYYRMQQLTELYHQTGNADYALKAMQLRRLMTKPYRLLVSLQGIKTEYSLSPLIPIERIEQLTGLVRTCKTTEEIEQLINNIRSYGN